MECDSFMNLKIIFALTLKSFMKYFYLILVTSITFFSCNSDIDLTAPYEDITIIYGLLDQTEDIQYIRINKSFLGDAPLADMAAVRDSVEYDDSDFISKRIEKWEGNVKIDEWELKDTLVEAINTSIFYVTGLTDPLRKVYYLDEVLEEGENIEYKVVVEIENKEEVFASTSLIKNSSGSILNPGSNTTGNSSQRIKFADQNSTVFGIYPNYKFKWRSEIGASLYELFLEMDYVEKVWESPAHEVEVSSEVKTLEWYLGSTKTNQIAQTISQREDLERTINGELFFQQVASRLEVNPNITREIGILNESIVDNHYSTFRFKLVVADEDFGSFIEFSEPSTSLAQERPQWTNITNGQGLFSSRLQQQSTDVRMDLNTMVELCIGQFTSSLNFCSRGASTDADDLEECSCDYLVD